MYHMFLHMAAIPEVIAASSAGNLWMLLIIRLLFQIPNSEDLAAACTQQLAIHVGSPPTCSRISIESKLLQGCCPISPCDLRARQILEESLYIPGRQVVQPINNDNLEPVAARGLQNFEVV